MTAWPIALVVAVGLAIAFLQIRTWLLRRRKSYQELLEPELNARGFAFLSAATPKLFDVGPFPKVEMEVGAYSHSSGPTGSGHYRQVRIVRFRDKAGAEREAWARLRFEFWSLKRIDWQPEL